MGQELLIVTGSFLGQVQRRRESILMTHLEILRLAPFFPPPTLAFIELKKKKKEAIKAAIS